MAWNTAALCQVGVRDHFDNDDSEDEEEEEKDNGLSSHYLDDVEPD